MNAAMNGMGDNTIRKHELRKGRERIKEFGKHRKINRDVRRTERFDPSDRTFLASKKYFDESNLCGVSEKLQIIF